MLSSGLWEEFFFSAGSLLMVVVQQSSLFCFSKGLQCSDFDHHDLIFSVWVMNSFVLGGPLPSAKSVFDNGMLFGFFLFPALLHNEKK